MSNGGKGYTQRPITDLDEFKNNWDNIFKKNKDASQEAKKTEHITQQRLRNESKGSS